MESTILKNKSLLRLASFAFALAYLGNGLFLSQANAQQSNTSSTKQDE